MIVASPISWRANEVGELVNDEIIIKQQKESTPDDPEDRYEVTQNLDKICKEFRDSGYLFKAIP
jgi:hypothetical protein